MLTSSTLVGSDMLESVWSVTIEQGEHVRSENTRATGLRYFEASGPQKDQPHKSFVLTLETCFLSASPYSRVARISVSIRYPSDEHFFSIPGESCLAAEAPELESEFIVDEVAPCAPRIFRIRAVEVERHHLTSPLGLQQIGRLFCQPQRPIPTVRVHERYL